MKVITVIPQMIRGNIEISRDNAWLGVFFILSGAIGNDVECVCTDFDYKKEYGIFFEIVGKSGGVVEYKKSGFSVRCGGNMRGTEHYCSGLEEYLPAIAMMCVFCAGESRIKGILPSERERMNEIASELSHLGAKTEVTADGLVINGCQVLNCDGAYVWRNPYLAMALIIGASRCEGELRILGTEELENDKFSEFIEIYNKIAEEKI